MNDDFGISSRGTRALLGSAWLAVLLTTLTAAPARSQATIGGDWRADVERFAGRLVDAGLTPGMAVAVTRDDWVLYADGFGLADVESGRGVDASTAFYIASSTKALTATAVILLAERGELDLDAPVTRYLPELRFRSPLDADSVTIRSLLTMTHGIDDGGPVVIRTAYTGEFTPETLLRLLADYGPSESGTVFDYGNLGYNILGMALAPGTAHGWKDVVRREVIDPLGMEATTARLSDLDPGWVAMPHAVVPGEGYRRIPLGKADQNLHAAGGHFTTAPDLARFVAAHASGGLVEGERVFPADPIVAAHREQVPQDRDFGPFHRHAWGYGWDVAEWEGKTVVQRFGAFAGYRSHMSFLPEHRLGVVVLVNGSGPASPAADLMATYVYDRLLGGPDLEATYDARLADLEARASEYADGLAEHLAERRARLAPLPHPLDGYAGIYESPKLGRMEWRVVADGLEMRMGVVRSRAEVYDAEQDQLRVEVGGGEVVDFSFPSEGPAESLEVRGERFVRLER